VQFALVNIYIIGYFKHTVGLEANALRKPQTEKICTKYANE